MGLTGEIGTEAEETTTTKEALSTPDADEWRQAMEEELQGLREKGSFKDEHPPSNRKPIKTRFVYKLKRGADREIERYKARPVAKGFTQQPVVDFYETFGPVIGFDVVRTIPATFAIRGWSLRVLDFKYLNAALYGRGFLMTALSKR